MEEKERDEILVKEEFSESTLGSVMEILLNTREQCEMVDHLIHNQIRVKDELIDKLHKELEQYKKELSGRWEDQLIKAIIKVRKDMVRQLRSENWDGMTADDLKREYVYVCEDLTDLLEQQNVDSYTTEIGMRFDPSIHQAKVEETDNQELDKTVKMSLGEGYTKGDKVILPERVIVYQYKE